MTMMRRLDVSDCLPGLLPASFRGVPFWVLNADHDAGRRLAQTLFPGRDGNYHDDLGLHDGSISISAIVVGDDYIAQAQRLERALITPGPGTLVHPWLGEKWVVLSTPANITFAANNLRVGTFDLIFEPSADDVDLVSTIAALAASIGGLYSAAAGLASTVLGAASMSLVVWATGRDAATAIAGTISTMAGRQATAPLYLSALETPVAAMSASEAMTPGADAATAIAAALVEMPRALVAAATAPLTSAIGRPVVGSNADPQNGAVLLLAITETAAGLDTIAQTDAAMTVATEAAALAGAAALICELAFESRQDALGWRDRLDNALAGCARRAAVLAGDAPGPVAVLRAAIASVRADLARDLSETIGRLPAVRTITPPATVSAFALAQHLVGDDPRAVVAMVNDITRRNRLSHPGAVPTDPVEVLL